MAQFKIEDASPPPPPKQIVLTLSPSELGVISWCVRMQFGKDHEMFKFMEKVEASL